MIRIFHNEQPGADGRAIDPIPVKPHTHRCPRCRERRTCVNRWCARMGHGYMVGSTVYQPVDLLCDACAGIKTPHQAPVVASSLEIITDEAQLRQRRNQRRRSRQRPLK